MSTSEMGTFGRETGREAREHSEGRVAHAIEQQAARLPSDAFVWASLAAMATGAILQLRESQRWGIPRQWGLFFGQWAAPLLLFGLYNKVVKVAGSDRVRARSGDGGARSGDGGF
jgi:hypothetical protein